MIEDFNNDDKTIVFACKVKELLDKIVKDKASEICESLKDSFVKEPKLAQVYEELSGQTLFNHDDLCIKCYIKGVTISSTCRIAGFNTHLCNMHLPMEFVTFNTSFMGFKDSFIANLYQKECPMHRSNWAQRDTIEVVHGQVMVGDRFRVNLIRDPIKKLREVTSLQEYFSLSPELVKYLAYEH